MGTSLSYSSQFVLYIHIFFKHCFTLSLFLKLSNYEWPKLLGQFFWMILSQSIMQIIKAEWKTAKPLNLDRPVHNLRMHVWTCNLNQVSVPVHLFQHSPYYRQQRKQRLFLCIVFLFFYFCFLFVFIFVFVWFGLVW